MEIGLLIARVIHVVGGVLWVGTLVFISFFLDPAMRDMGPEGSRVLPALARHKFIAFVPIVAFSTVLSGFYLYGKASAGFNSVYMKSGPGMTYAAGATSAILAIIVGMSVVRPAAMKATALAQQAAGATESDRERISADLRAQQMKASKGGRIVAVLLLLTATAMAVGRYV